MQSSSSSSSSSTVMPSCDGLDSSTDESFPFIFCTALSVNFESRVLSNAQHLTAVLFQFHLLHHATPMITSAWKDARRNTGSPLFQLDWEIPGHFPDISLLCGSPHRVQLPMPCINYSQCLLYCLLNTHTSHVKLT